jgi:uncharacterized protein
VSKPLSARNNLAVQQQQRGDVGQNTGQANNQGLNLKLSPTNRASAMAPNPVTWFELNVLDIERAKAFYAAVFQVAFQDFSNPEMAYWCFPMDDNQAGAGGALMQMAGCEPGKGGTMVYFNCEDCAVEESRVAPAGGTVCRPKMAIGTFGFISVVIDTEGNPIGLHSLQ